MDFGCAVREIAPVELKKRLDAGEEIVIIDVREPRELEICKLANTIHIPLGFLPERIKELDGYKDKEVVVYCLAGGRSHKAAGFLNASGFKSVYNLAGGILAWADQVDPTIQKY